jgi:hypothetical protein
MEHRDPSSPLPPDPAGREDIMSDEPGAEAPPAAREGAPLSPDPASREDVIPENRPGRGC